MSGFDSVGSERFLAALSAVPRDVVGPPRIVMACVAVLAVQRAAIAVEVTGTGWEVLCASDSAADRFEALQATVGQGPGIDAAVRGEVVVVEDLALIQHRWPLLGAAMDPGESGAVYSIPLQAGAVRLGVLDLFCAEPGRLDGSRWVAVSSVATMVTMILLSDQNADGAEMVLGQWWNSAPHTRDIHQASGMVAAQLGIPVRDAYSRLQAHAFARGFTLAEVAVDVVARRLHFNPASEVP
ncbi:GAF and ANTAR domain-containing protein [Nocardia blacklockiae]|uniref:GAF and ANTAR domain-containing protein n=1 Tax=Nocardia blacklockiae TaxID=480036 RepID=UPI0018943098|nr:GAF and ANTAR domain-containing protein [Nocardia blacklockiae]MBF6172344.1 GAF and ANTAR domain-containing protein [Nocardia blacklockiae]